ncbi:basic proline-rich protein-like [Budorcas taxicolor]|uniref:basic proline-rich protein-like n=1 Tax=Budorcas taxicolor TaxID=37181 RepID=UPI00228462B6|nr:basic proline-rich protein-like [Budorcas taxicolor]
MKKQQVHNCSPGAPSRWRNPAIQEVRGRGVGVLLEPGWPKGAESGETWCAPSPARVTPLKRSRTQGPKPADVLPPAPRRPPGAGDDAPRGPGSGVRGSHSPRLAPRPPAPSTHGPLARRYLAILGRRPGAAGVRSRPWAAGVEEGGRAPPAASAVSPPPVPEQGCCRRPRAKGGPLPSASSGGRRRRHGRAEATVTATTTGETLQPRLRRAGAVPARRSAGGAATRVPAPPPAPPRAPPPEAARAPPPSPLGGAARVRRFSRGRPLEPEESGRARGSSAEGGASAESPVARPISEGHGRVGERSGLARANGREGRPSARRPCKESGSRDAVKAHCKHCMEEKTTRGRVLASSVNTLEN